MATEDQIQQLWQDIIRLEERIDYCCREIVYWDFRIRIRDKFGNIVSDYLENRTTGITRRGKNFTMKLPIKAIPKYEMNIAGINTASAYIDGNNLNCVQDGTLNTIANGLCSLLYRGTSGEYFEMSQRKTTAALGFSRTASGTNAMESFMVDENGNVGNANYINSTYNFRFPLNSHFAYVNDENDVLIDVMFPIGDLERFSGNTDDRRPYGRIYQFDLRDVTL